MAKFVRVVGAYLNFDNILSVYFRNSVTDQNVRIAQVFFVGYDEGVEYWGDEAEAIEHWLMSNADGVEKAEIDS